MNVHQAPKVDTNESNYAHCRVEEVIDMQATDFFEWYLRQRLENFMKGTMVVPPITGSEALEGPQWGEVDSARKIFFKDGTEALERIIATDFPNGYEYQPWAYTSPVRLLSDFATSNMRAVQDGDQTRIIWDYAFHSKSALALPVLKLFVMLDWKRNLTGGLKIIKQHIEAHGTAVDLHQADGEVALAA